MFSPELLFTIILAFAVVTVSPGPSNIATAGVAMRFGRRDSLLFGAGLGFGPAFWGVIAATGMGADSGSGHVMLATAICMALGFANYTVYALAFSLPGFMAGYKRFRRWIEGVVAGLFAAAGFTLIRSALAR